MPFLVTVNINPLRRQIQKSRNEPEILPFFELSEEEEIDEWDDPSVSLEGLKKRIRQAEVELFVSSELNNEELLEIKESLYRNLQLIPARDEIQIKQRPWTHQEIPWTWILLATGVLFTFLIGLGLINRISVKKLISGLESSQAFKNKGDQSQAAPLAQGFSQAPTTDLQSSSVGKSTSHAQTHRYDDPVKVRRLVQEAVESILSKNHFPTLQDMMILDSLGRKDPASLGALLQYFPKKTQSRLFELSHGEVWVKALSEPGEISYETFTVLEKLLAIHREEENDAWQGLLLSLWRMDDRERKEFLKEIQQDEALYILHQLPKDISIPTARQVFPGNWAGLLEPIQQKPDLKKDRIQKLKESAESKTEMRSLEVLYSYKQVQELLHYLRTSEISEERDIYEACREDSLLCGLRPPFYKVLEAEDRLLSHFVSSVDLKTWAMAFFNAPRGYRDAVEKHFEEKQTLFFRELLKSLDQNQRPSSQKIGEAREAIGRRFEAFSKSFELFPENSSESEEGKLDEVA
jgi:hypothetical protein